MKQKSSYLGAALAVCLAFIGVTFAQSPETDIDPAKHRNLAKGSAPHSASSTKDRRSAKR